MTISANRQTHRILKRMEPGMRAFLEPAVENGVVLKPQGKHIGVYYGGERIHVVSYGSNNASGWGDIDGLTHQLEKLGALTPGWRDPPAVRRARTRRGEKSARALMVKVRLQEKLVELNAVGGRGNSPTATRRGDWLRSILVEGGSYGHLQNQMNTILRTPPDELKLTDGKLAWWERVLGITPVAVEEIEPDIPTPEQREMLAEPELAVPAQEPPPTALVNALHEKEKTIKQLLERLEEAQARVPIGNHPEEVSEVLALVALADPTQAQAAVDKAKDVLLLFRQLRQVV